MMLLYVVIPFMLWVLYFILFYFILFILLYPDVMGNSILRSYDLINLLCFGRWNSQIFILITLV